MSYLQPAAGCGAKANGNGKLPQRGNEEHASGLLTHYYSVYISIFTLNRTLELLKKTMLDDRCPELQDPSSRIQTTCYFTGLMDPFHQIMTYFLTPQTSDLQKNSCLSMLGSDCDPKIIKHHKKNSYGPPLAQTSNKPRFFLDCCFSF